MKNFKELYYDIKLIRPEDLQFLSRSDLNIMFIKAEEKNDQEAIKIIRNEWIKREQAAEKRANKINVESYKEYYAKMRGQKTKPTIVYQFVNKENNKPLTEHGKVVTRNAYSPAQAIRYLKLNFPALQHKNIEAVAYAPAPSQPVIAVPCQTCKPPDSDQDSGQLKLNV